MLRYLLLLVTLLGLSSCAANLQNAYPDKTPMDRLFRDTCGVEGAICLPADDVEALKLLKDPVRYGEFHASELMPGVRINVRLGVALIETDVCAKDLDACGFVIEHELGHWRMGPDQTDADCYAASRTTAAQRKAGIALVCKIEPGDRCAALESCAAKY